VLGFQLLDRRDGVSCRKAQREALGFSVPWGNGTLVPPAEYKGTAFLPSMGNLVFLLFNRGVRALLLSRTVGSAGPLLTAAE
jgi:hypothetical protein